ncbi:MAG TPA: AAA family ATPase [Candidatus Paceibacterota bacterium]|nr:AAA family ATPase [Candidatus Paceibacterota bacterium]
MTHFLKRLELNGFKSFAGKTVLEFPAGIVAVVGPNGSGKSNIVDAIRWLLGERDAKNLRGAKVEDLIFSGTVKRPRVGMASASLHFENKNKFFPVDYEEVVVTREIRRDGQSKYYLNKSEILLRDLIDFFAKARLGSRGLIIIGQGDSDLFIRSTPLERREMIEEILGLREYQLKKADAERRLKNSKINLDKVTALIEEILPHLRSLKRQTGRWERRGALEEELKLLESQFFGSQLHELHAKIGAIEKELAEHKKQYEHLEKEKKAAMTRQAAIEASQPEERKELQKVKEEIRKLIESKSDLQKDLGRVEAQIEMARKTGGAKGDRSAEHLVDVLQKIKSELEEALGEEPLGVQAAIETVLEEIRFALEEHEDRPASQGPIPDGLRRDLEKTAEDLQELERNIGALRDKEKSLEVGQEEFYKNFKAAVADVQVAQNHLDEWEKVNREFLLQKERVDLRREEVLHQLEQAGRRAEEFRDVPLPPANGMDFGDMERRIFRLRGDLASIGEVDEALMKEATDTETRYQFLQKESEDLTKAVNDLTSLMMDLSEKIKSEFEKSLSKINDEFDKFFGLMFGGGSARLKVLKPKEKIEEEDEGAPETAAEHAKAEKDKEEEEAMVMEKEGGVEIEVKLPRKKTTSLDMLSGGERSLVGIAALFAMVSVSPPPFLVLDEIDAPLDERNARRFGEMLREFEKRTQFIVVTHNRATMEAAEILYGVTLSEDGSSKIVSLKLAPEEAGEKVAAQ